MRDITLICLASLLLCVPALYGQSDLYLERLLEDSTKHSEAYHFLEFVSKPKPTGGKGMRKAALVAKDWEEGYLVDLQDHVFRLKGKLDWKNDQLSILVEDKIVEVYLESIKGWKDESGWWVPAEYRYRGRQTQVGMYILLVDGRLNLLKRPQPLGSKYYLRIADRSVNVINKRRRSLLKNLPAKRDAVRKYIKKNGLNMLKEEDLKMTVIYYNSLY